MRTFIPFLLGVGVVLLLILAAAPNSDDRLYGTVITHDGDRYEGFIRWDKNEASWVDILDGTKHLDRAERRADRRRTRKMRLFGFEFEFDDEDDGWGRGWSSSRSAGIRFGHLRSLENTGRNQARLTLRSGQEIELGNRSTDIGNGVRGILVEDGGHGVVELHWRDIDRIDFRRVPRGVHPARSGERLYGTLTTRDGLAFSGYVCWDVDEVLGDDILDGEDERGRDRKIPFAEIAAIAHNSSRSARVTLTSGEELVLRGTNDVNSSNNDILVLDPHLGQVRVPWEAFDEVVFAAAPSSYHYDRFYTSGPLVGEVTTRSRRTFTGEIRWDNDESYTWEMIDGEMDGVDFDIELGLIRSIERVSSQAARVTLFDGRAFELRGSNDVNHENSGIYVTSKDSEDRIDWDEFDRVQFEKP